VTDRRMERICLSTLKQLDTVLETWAFMEASESRYMPRSRTDLAKVHEIGADTCGFTWNLVLPSTGRAPLHLGFAVFSCRRLLHIHNATSSTHADILSVRAA